MSEKEEVAKEETVEVKRAEVEEVVLFDGSNVSAANFDAVTEQVKQKPESVKNPLFFVENDEMVEIVLDILYSKQDGSILSVSKSGLGRILETMESEGVGFCSETFKFSQPSYSDMTRYRQGSTRYNRDAEAYWVDTAMMRHFLLVCHLKDWTLRDKKGEKVELAFDPKGNLDTVTLKIIDKGFAVMFDVLMTAFEQAILLR